MAKDDPSKLNPQSASDYGPMADILGETIIAFARTLSDDDVFIGTALQHAALDLTITQCIKARKPAVELFTVAMESVRTAIINRYMVEAPDLVLSPAATPVSPSSSAIN